MIGRYEQKFALPVTLRSQLMDVVRGSILPDPIARNLAPRFPDGEGYTVHSLYFDTPHLTDYRERLADKRIRDRLRIRTYGHGDGKLPVFLENKRKMDDRVVKQRVKICTLDQWRNTPGPTPWVEWVERLQGKNLFAGRHFCHLIERDQRRPISIVHYLREVYVPADPREDARARFTLDHDVSATTHIQGMELIQPPDTPLMPEGWMVVELKFGEHRPAWMNRLVRELGLIASPVSKFGMSIAVQRDSASERRFFTPAPLRSAVALPRVLQAQRSEQ